MQLNGLVVNPVSTSYGDGSFPLISQGRQGEALVSELHGKWYTSNYRGSVYIAASAAAGVTLPANANNLVSVWSLWNPVGSGYNAELIDLDVFFVTATEVVAAIGFVIQSNVGSAIAVPGTLTKASPLSGNGGAAIGATKAGFYSALTHVGTPSIYKWLGGAQATANGEQSPHTEFDGKIIVAPGTVISLISSVAQTQPCAVSMSWAEYPTP